MLTLNKIVKSFSEHAAPILDGIDLSLSQGESLAIMGASGSGKSSLLNIVAGLIPADSGTVQFDEINLTALCSKQYDAFRCRHLGMVFQQFNLIECLSVIDNVTLPARYLKLDYENRGRELLSRLGLQSKFTAPVTELSGGEQQRVAIARALTHKPKLILADEPTGNLDTQTSQSVASMLYELVKTTNTAMLIVTHSDDVAERADRVVHLQQGELRQ